VLTVGPFQVQGEIARGGAGVVYRALDPNTQRVVALKVLHGGGFANPLPRKRFEREALALAKVRHPNVVAIHSYAFSEGGEPYVVMELVEGESLQERLDRHGKLGPDEALDVVLLLCDALVACHTGGVLHRDLKPDNVLVAEDGALKLTDFGLARDTDPSTSRTQLTVQGQFLGSPGYWAPEQARGQVDRVGVRTDVYGLGAILFALLTGRPPHQGGSLVEIMSSLERGTPPPSSSSPAISADLDRVVARALASDPEDRYASVEALRADLRRVRRGEPLEGSGLVARPRMVAAATLLLGVLGAGGAVLLTGDGEPPAASTAATEDAARATLTLDPVPAGPHRSQTLRLTGAARHAVHVEARVGTMRDPVRARVVDMTFSLEVELDEGSTRVQVVAFGADGAEGEREKLHVVYEPLPGWYLALEGEARPPQPLPPGVEPTRIVGEYRHAKDGSALVYVPPTTFLMGNEGLTLKDMGRMLPHHVRPIHQVTLSEGFFVGRYELSLAQYEAFERATGRPPRPGWGESGYQPDGAPGWRRIELTPAHPAFNLSWADAQAYCEWAGLRLPTEAEWNLAAAGPQGWQYPWGDGLAAFGVHGVDQTAPVNLTSRLGTNRDIPSFRNDPYVATCPVDALEAGASPCGALNMLGNVQEWVADWFGPYPEGAVTDPRGPPSSPLRVVRGGHWDGGLGYASTWARVGQDPRQGDEVTGFRVALSAE
jgi:formylglycine-generating enzyme required for sulfatase activity